MESSAQVEAEGRGQLFFGRRGGKEGDKFKAGGENPRLKASVYMEKWRVNLLR